MRKLMILLLLLLALAVMCAGQNSKAELGVNYNWMHTNYPPGGDTTTGMNGGSVSLAWRLSRSWSMVGDVGAAHVSDVPVAGEGLTVSYYTVGPRYYLRRKASSGEKRWQKITPYGQVEVGIAHASGLLAAGAHHSDNAFAMKVGGGFEVPLARRIVFRPAQTEYLLTLFHNGVNDRQNNFLYGAGVVLRLR